MNHTCTILCGTDLSPGAVRAADVAAAFARKRGEPMLLASIAETVLSGHAARFRKQAIALDRDALEREADRLRALGATVEVELLSGLPSDELIALSRQCGAQLVVVSSHGHRAAVRWLLGSVAESVAEGAPVPTLVVRDAAPIQAWLRGERALRVFVGTDFTAQSDAALDWVRALREFGPCEVHAAYVAWEPMPTPLAPEFPVVPELARDFHEDEAKIARDLEEKIATHLGTAAAQVHVAAGSGRVDSRLVELAAEVEADLIVVGSHQWHGIERLWRHSVSRGILHHAKTNVACVPSPAA